MGSHFIRNLTAALYIREFAEKLWTFGVFFVSLDMYSAILNCEVCIFVTVMHIDMKIYQFERKNARKSGFFQKTIVFGIFAKIGAILNKNYFAKVISFCDKHLNSFEENRFSNFLIFTPPYYGYIDKRFREKNLKFF